MFIFRLAHSLTRHAAGWYSPPVLFLGILISLKVAPTAAAEQSAGEAISVDEVSIAPHETLPVGVPGHWCELRVHLRSQTYRRQQGDVVAMPLEPWGWLMIRFMRPGVTIPSAGRVVHLPVFWPLGAKPRLALSVRDGDETVLGRFTVTASAGMGPIVYVASREPFALSGHQTTIIGQGASFQFITASRSSPDVLPGERLLTANPASSPLPHRPLCWTGISHIIWLDYPPHALSPEQQEALRVWLELGGVLLVSGGGDTANWMGSGLETVLPAMAGASRSLELTHADENHPPLVVNRRELRLKPTTRGVTWLKTPDGQIYGVERRIGLGRVVQLCFSASNPGFLEWKGASRYWQRWMFGSTRAGSAATGIRLLARDLGRRNLGAASTLDPQAPSPSTVTAMLYDKCAAVSARKARFLVVALLGSYVLAVGTIHFVGVRRRTAWNWGLVLVCSLAVVGLIFLGTRYGQRQAAVIELVGTCAGSQHAYRGLYMAVTGTRAETVQPRAHDSDTLLVEIDALADSPGPWFNSLRFPSQLTYMPTRLTLQVFPRAPRTLLAETIESHETPFFPLSIDGTELTNATGLNLRDVTLVATTGCMPLQRNWPPGTSLALSGAKRVGFARTDVDQEFLRFLELAREDRVLPRPYLVAWSDEVGHVIDTTDLRMHQGTRSIWFVFLSE